MTTNTRPAARRHQATAHAPFATRVPRRSDPL